MESNEAAWLEAVAESLAAPGGEAAAQLSDADVRALLNLTKVTADATGIRYLAPLTAFLVGEAIGRTGGTDRAEALRGAREAIDLLAKSWTPATPPPGG